MRLARWEACAMGAALALSVFVCACASAPAPPPVAPEAEDPDVVVTEPAPPVTVTGVDTPERSRAPSKASYEEALSVPEPIDVQDERAHLTDGQLTGPVRNSINGCRVPSNGKVTIKTAVQNGRAIGVTVEVRFVRPKSARPLSRGAARAEAKASAKIAGCIDRNVRAIVWPPNRRRDSFTTEF